MNQGNLHEAKRTFLTCADIPDENLKDPHAHKSSVTSCLYNLGKLLHEQGQQEVSLFWKTFKNLNNETRDKTFVLLFFFPTSQTRIILNEDL